MVDLVCCSLLSVYSLKYTTWGMLGAFLWSQFLFNHIVEICLLFSSRLICIAIWSNTSLCCLSLIICVLNEPRGLWGVSTCDNFTYLGSLSIFLWFVWELTFLFQFQTTFNILWIGSIKCFVRNYWLLF